MTDFPIEPLPAGCICRRNKSLLDPQRARAVVLSDAATPSYTPRADCPVHGDPASQMQDAESVINGKKRDQSP